MAATTSCPHIIGFENRIAHRHFGRRKNPLAPQPFPKVGQQIKPRLENAALQEHRVSDRRPPATLALSLAWDLGIL
jgi:hypothetical protein